MQCLCVLSRIDHDLVKDSTRHILPKFLTVPRSLHGESLATHANEYLTLALSFHTKTRTLPIHISHLMDSCTQLPPHSSSLPIRASYDSLVASPVFTMSHLSKLSMAVRIYITPGQTLDTASQVLVVLREIWERFRGMEKAAAADRGRGQRKKRRISETSSNTGKEDAAASAVTFTLAARIAATVLTSLPLHTITEAEQARTKTIVADSLTGFVREAILAGTDVIISGSGDRERDDWSTQIVAAAALRLQYMLQTSRLAWYGPNDQNDLGELVAAGLKPDDCLPEYSVNIVSRMLWDHTRRTHGIHSSVTYCTMNLNVTFSSSRSFLTRFWISQRSISQRTVLRLRLGQDGLHSYHLMRVVLHLQRSLFCESCWTEI